MFGSDKTEAPTPRRREEARKQGMVPRSAELTGALVLLFGVAVALFALPLWGRHLREAMGALIVYGDWSPLWRKVVPGLLAYIVGLMGIALMVGLLQTKFLFTLSPLRPDWQKIHPLTGFRRLFSFPVLWELGRAALKALLIGSIGFLTLRAGLHTVVGATRMDVPTGVAALGEVGSRLVWRIVGALLGLALLDYVIQWWRVERSLRMTRQEVKEEVKNTEGNPQVKAHLRRRYRQLVMHRQIQRVREATVVITNPTHLAVALRYHPQELPAPQVVAKGTDWLAQRIVREAQRHAIPVVRNAPLARALIKVPLGTLIPPELYQAAAEVLAYVFRVTGRAQEVLGEA